jgi:hypothetical protein
MTTEERSKLAKEAYEEAMDALQEMQMYTAKKQPDLARKSQEVAFYKAKKAALLYEDVDTVETRTILFDTAISIGIALGDRADEVSHLVKLLDKTPNQHIMKQIVPTEKQLTTPVKIFLAGSVQTGDDWREVLMQEFNKVNIEFFNPKIDSWDESWEEAQHNSKFNNQINWELNTAEESDIIFLYLHPKSKSPISLLELGLYAQTNKLIVCCPDGFWKKGNIDIVCTRYNIPIFDEINKAIGGLKTKILHI